MQLAHVTRANEKHEGEVSLLEAELVKSSAMVAELRAEKASLQCGAAAAAARATVSTASMASQLSQKDQVRFKYKINDTEVNRPTIYLFFQ